MRLPRPKCTTSAGFTLLEIILVMFVVSLLLSGIFAIVSGTAQLADDIEREQNRDAQIHSFAQFCDRTLRSLPANGQVRLRIKQSGSNYLSELALKNAPSAFAANMGGRNSVTVLETEDMPGGYMRAVLKSVKVEDGSGPSSSSRNGSQDGPKLVLLEDVAKCEWKFLDPQNGEWQTVWNEKLKFGPDQGDQGGAAGSSIPEVPVPGQGGAQAGGDPTQSLGSQGGAVGGRRPGLIELNIAISGDAAPRRFVFWMPPAKPNNAGGPGSVPNPAASPDGSNPPGQGPQVPATPPPTR